MKYVKAGSSATLLITQHTVSMGMRGGAWPEGALAGGAGVVAVSDSPHDGRCVEECVARVPAPAPSAPRPRAQHAAAHLFSALHACGWHPTTRKMNTPCRAFSKSVAYQT